MTTINTDFILREQVHIIKYRYFISRIQLYTSAVVNIDLIGEEDRFIKQIQRELTTEEYAEWSVTADQYIDGIVRQFIDQLK